MPFLVCRLTIEVLIFIWSAVSLSEAPSMYRSSIARRVFFGSFWIMSYASTDGSNVFIRQMKVASAEGRAGRHLFSTAGYLDSSWFNRTFWNVGGVKMSGLMVSDGDSVHGVEIYPGRGTNSLFTPGARGYQLSCFSLTRPPAPVAAKGARRPSQKATWQQRVAIRITAMVRTADKVFVAGSPDVVDPKDPHGAWEGRKGGVLAVFNATDGSKLSEVKLDAPPVWDGMAATTGHLFISTMDGQVVCLKDTGSPLGNRTD